MEFNINEFHFFDCPRYIRSLKKSSLKYLLTCIDVFSKRAWALPLKNKSSKATARAFRSILRYGKPRVVQTDGGKEFRGLFEKLLSDRDIKFIVSYNPDIKCAVVERFNRTLKGRIWKYFTQDFQVHLHSPRYYYRL